MNTRQFFTGLGIGMVAGGTIGMMVTGNRKNGKHMVSRALRGMGDVIDDVSAALSR